MTRVNLVDPRILTDQHLIAERLELTFVVSSAQRSFLSKGGLKTSDTFTLGQGHVTFFHDKLGYIENRFYRITKEMLKRGMNPKMEFPSIEHFPDEMRISDYMPSKRDIGIIKERIRDRILMKPEWYKFHKNALPIDFIEKYYPIDT